ncbi:MAG: hypothetical protein Q8P18_04115 [Pseudomonadota bacterium]|nr:hypothetical protein [Pseudomonadota bacterium]
MTSVIDKSVRGAAGLLLFLLAGIARASAPGEANAPLAADPLAALSRGDEAWWGGDRGGAIAAWREALDASEGVPDPALAAATEAMARVRLLQLGGSVAPFVHEAKLNRALSDCPAREPWCGIAAADWELFMPAFTGADPARVPELLVASPLVGPAAARIAVATGDRTALDALPAAALDGMGRGIRATGQRAPPAPGTWVVGIGVGGAPGAGVGFTLRFAHPDLGWRRHRLELIGGADTRGGFSFGGTLLTATRPGLAFGAGAARAVADRWVDGAATPYELATARLSAAVAPQWDLLGVSVGAVGRVEWFDSTLLPASNASAATPASPAVLAGPTASLTLGDATARVRLAGELNLGSYTYIVLSADARAAPDLAGGTLALRLAATRVPTDAPFYRLPSAGGADLLRGLPAGRFRGDTLLAGQIEYRHAIWGPLHGALFVDGAKVDGWHVTAGGGVRIVLPPDRYNVTRLDIGVGPEGWGVVAAWGEAF